MDDNDSILLTVKKMLGIEKDYNVFDTDLIIYINSIIASLDQIGVSSNGFCVTDKSDIWDDYVTDQDLCSMIKSYIVMNVRMMFDPPSSSFVMDAIDKQAKELEWRINLIHEGSDIGDGE